MCAVKRKVKSAEDTLIQEQRKIRREVERVAREFSTVKTYFEYTGKREDEFCVVGKVTGKLYKIKEPGQIFPVEPGDETSFQRKFFDVTHAPDPWTIEPDAEPLKGPTTIDPTDGISDEEAMAAEQTLRSYRRERVGKKADDLLAVESHDPKDYLDVVTAYEEWKDDPSSARPYEEFRDELVEEGKLDAD